MASPKPRPKYWSTAFCCGRAWVLIALHGPNQHNSRGDCQLAAGGGRPGHRRALSRRRRHLCAVRVVRPLPPSAARQDWPAARSLLGRSCPLASSVTRLRLRRGACIGCRLPPSHHPPPVLVLLLIPPGQFVRKHLNSHAGQPTRHKPSPTPHRPPAPGLAAGFERAQRQARKQRRSCMAPRLAARLAAGQRAAARMVASSSS